MRIHQRQGDLYPDDDETYEDFMDRCTDEIGDEDVCQLIWDDRGAKDVCHKTHASKVAGLEFVLSDETPDRMGDVIMADGWELTNFQKNPIALFGHNSSFPIGKWKNLRVVDKQLRGFLEMAPAGTSERVDEIRKLIDADILRAVSVGFRPKASQAAAGIRLRRVLHQGRTARDQPGLGASEPECAGRRQVTEHLARHHRSGFRRERQWKPEQTARVHRRACRHVNATEKGRGHVVVRSTHHRCRAAA